MDDESDGPPGTPAAFETMYGWVIAGSGVSCHQVAHVTSHHSSIVSGDELLQKFWETEESPTGKPFPPSLLRNDWLLNTFKQITLAIEVVDLLYPYRESLMLST